MCISLRHFLLKEVVFVQKIGSPEYYPSIVRLYFFRIEYDVLLASKL